MARRKQIERASKGTNVERAMHLLRHTIADFEEIEREVQAAERRARLEVAPDLRLIDRMARLGFSKHAIDEVTEMLGALDDIKNGRPLSRRAQAILSDLMTAIRSADQQLAAILAARRRD